MNFSLILASVATIGLWLPGGALSQDRIGPIEDYLLNPGREVALALSAAPPSVSSHATVLVLTPAGYRRERSGDNGFVCLVNRGWQADPHPHFWDPATLAPVCHNAEAARTVLAVHRRKTELALAGNSMAAIDSTISAELSSGVLEPPGRRAFAYMVSPDGFAVIPGYRGPIPPHVMVWMPGATQLDLGQNPPLGPSPFVLGAGEPMAVAIIPVAAGPPAGE